MSDHPNVLRFDAFELDTGAGELRKNGDRIKLAPQPFRVLELLVRRSGEVLTRAEIRESVWRNDTFVDFEQGLNFCIRQIREAVGDAAGTPRFIETLPRRGYRFLLPVEAPPSGMPREWTASKAACRCITTRLIVLPFRILRPDPATDFLAFSLADALATSLSAVKSFVVRSSLAASRYSAATLDLKTIAVEADVDLILTGTLLSAGDEIRVVAQLTEAASGTLMCSHSMQAPTRDIFRLQDEITDCVVNALKWRLTSGERRTLRQDVPSSAKAYEYYLRANQFSHDPNQWNAARDLYLRCLEADPCFAPAWARLGRIYHVTAKYLPSENKDGLQRAEAAFREALDLNPDLAIAHKSYAQLEVDLGRSNDAIHRLIPLARAAANPEIFAALVSPLRYTGLLTASFAAHRCAVALDSRIRTSVPYTWFLQENYRRVAGLRLEDYPYIVGISLSEEGRKHEAISGLRALEAKVKTRMGDFARAARTMLEGDTAASVDVVECIVSSEFSDPEGLYNLARHLAHLNRVDSALSLLERVVAGGFFCYPAMLRDPWLEPLRAIPGFTSLLRSVEEKHLAAQSEFSKLGGNQALQIEA
jgi:DNA-binding winged helix-turn-helix (wHTH) protein/tetratricopeptide (TPR) repeat protein